MEKVTCPVCNHFESIQWIEGAGVFSEDKYRCSACSTWFPVETFERYILHNISMRIMNNICKYNFEINHKLPSEYCITIRVEINYKGQNYFMVNERLPFTDYNNMQTVQKVFDKVIDLIREDLK